MEKPEETLFSTVFTSYRTIYFNHTINMLRDRHIYNQ